MSDDAFSQPLRGDKFEPEQFDGALLLFYPTEYFSSIPTQHGDTAVVDTHIVALDRPDLTGQPTVLRDARVFGRAMVPQLKGAVGGKAVLGRLGQGQNTKGKAPWLLKDYSEADAAFARQYMATHPDPRDTPSSAPTVNPAPPISNGYAAPVTAIGSPEVPTQYAPTPNPGAAYGAPVPAAAPARDPGLVAYLQSKGVDVDKLPPSADLAVIAQTLG